MSTSDHATKTAKDAGPDESGSNIVEGKLVSLIGHKLVMKNSEGRESSHSLIRNTKIMCDATDCKAEDLKAGSRIRVTTRMDDRNVATGIESLHLNTAFSTCAG